MRNSARGAIALLVALGASAGPALAQYGMDKSPPKNSATPELPKCDRPLGTAAIQEPQTRWWEGLGLSSPESLIKLFAMRSGCLRIVDRNAGLAMRAGESALNSSGELRRGSNLGRGQITAADYFIVPDIANSNRNSGGGGIGALGGALIGGPVGLIIGGLNVKKSEAHTLLTLEDARTTEQLYIAEGVAQKSDLSFGLGGGAGGLGGFGGAAGGGYSDTNIGKVISAAYFRSFVDLVGYMQRQSGGARSASAPAASQTVTALVKVRAEPTPTSKVVFVLQPGAAVYPTGKRDGVWMEVDDENGNRGWMSSVLATSR